ncbi:MAG TPA: DsrE/DsrF/DrsH-like family protein [Candidatus Limnocylindrales bacterium]|nr:DsrE/DsrF/DrsH-like family protein [Candidatus Limnocylindrales bacterium]
MTTPTLDPTTTADRPAQAHADSVTTPSGEGQPALEPREPETVPGVTIVVFSGDFDRVQAAFNIAVGAASSGQPVTMFFTFWGLDVITRPNASRIGRDPLRTAFRWMKPGGARRLPLTRFNFFGLGPKLMGRLMGEFKMPTVPEMLDLARSMNVKIVACTITMGVMGLTKDDLIDVDSYAGVATYLKDANERRVNLFI